MNFNKLNNIFGWSVFGIATIVYLITVERTASYWDCGEFIAVSYKLMVPHPPGAPFFLLMGRMFSFLAFGDVTQVAYWINVLSILSGAFTILFLFWAITLFGRKLLKTTAEEANTTQTWLLLAAGTVGALAYTFSDSFWFSAGEAEVYAMSSFFTAFVVWAVLKWELIEDESRANRWLILIAYMTGLSIGVHLLNLVTIPALALIYYFKKKEQITKWGLFATIAVSGIIILIIMVGVIPGLPSIAGNFEIFFVNSLGLPFGSGVVVFVSIFIGALVYSIRYSERKNKETLNTILLCFAFVIVGYSSYALVVIRSNFNPPINENNPSNIMTFVSYLKREQYGNRPLVHGQYFDADIIAQERGAAVYIKGEDKYIISDYKVEQIYNPERTTILPRSYSADPNHIQVYRRIMDLGPNDIPTFGDNLEILFKRQMGHMYWRYFMWNFSGRQSDIQDAGYLTVADAFTEVPPSIGANKARNNYFSIPLILGILGLWFCYKRNLKIFAVLAMLFFLTGLGLILYLNSPPIEPRERDYIYAGSYYVYAIWIGFAVFWVYNVLTRFISNSKLAIGLAGAVSLSAPILMAAENWDDHNRNHRYFSVDSAKNFLTSCTENAILFTGGDNDTFPLWYVQDVEGFRTDVRVVVLSYFNTDWYIEQMTRQSYESAPFPFSLTSEKYRQGGPNDYLPFVENPKIKGAIDLKQYLRLIESEHPALKVPTSVSSYNSVPSKTLFLNVDKEAVLSKGIIPKGMEDLVVDRMYFTVKGSGLEKKDLMILDIIANGNWDRPIYFNNTSRASVNVNLTQYLIQEGNSYRLLPILNPNAGSDFVNVDIMYENLMNRFAFRELDNPNAYFTEDYRNFVVNHRSSFNTLAESLINQGDMEKARQVILKSLELMPDNAIPYDYTTSRSVNILFTVGEKDKALEISSIMGTRADEELTYYVDSDIQLGFEIQRNLVILSDLYRTLSRFGEDELAGEFNNLFNNHRNRLQVFNAANR